MGLWLENAYSRSFWKIFLGGGVKWMKTVLQFYLRVNATTGD